MNIFPKGASEMPGVKAKSCQKIFNLWQFWRLFRYRIMQYLILKLSLMGLEATALQGYNSTLNLCYACLKIGILLHKKAAVRFILITIVCVALIAVQHLKAIIGHFQFLWLHLINGTYPLLVLYLCRIKVCQKTNFDLTFFKERWKKTLPCKYLCP